MTDHAATEHRQLDAVRKLIRGLAGQLNAQVSVRLWDGSVEPLGENVTSPLQIAISGPGVIGAIMRRPTLDNIIRHYIDKRIDFSGGTLIDLGRAFDRDGRAVSVRKFKRLELLRQLSAFLMTPAESPPDAHGFDGEISGRAQHKRDNKAFVQFHYDLSNEFYALFLDPEMVYSCAYFTDWENDIAQAQRDKLEMICRKLRLKPGERMLDVGSGWGGAGVPCGAKFWRYGARHNAQPGTAGLRPREGFAVGACRQDHVRVDRLCERFGQL